MSHTPGPWTAKVYERSNVVVIHGPGWDEVAIVDLASMPDPEADAHLIAAAPDLLDACRCVMECAEMSGAVRAMIEDAIKKAMGAT